MAIRRGPTHGYRFGNKAQYRRTIWSQFRKFFNGHVAGRHALLMPSIEGLEIEVALNNGFRENCLHVVDMNPAIVATLKRKYPNIHTYGVSAACAIQRIIKSGIKLSCANFDFTSPLFTYKNMLNVSLCGNPSAYEALNAVAITVLCGRDDSRLLNLKIEWAKAVRNSQIGNPAFSISAFSNESDLARVLSIKTLLSVYNYKSGRESNILAYITSAGIGKYVSPSSLRMLYTIIYRDNDIQVEDGSLSLDAWHGIMQAAQLRTSVRGRPVFESIHI